MLQLTSKSNHEKGSSMSYKHLTQEQRYHIQAYKSRSTNKEIAKQIGVHPSTICREIKRNKGKILGIYFAHAAHKKAKRRQVFQSANANLKLTNETIKLIKKYLTIQYSPEQIAATLTLKHYQPISHVTVYKYIYLNRLNEGNLYKQLRHRGKRRIKYGSKRKRRVKDRVSIEKRPAIVDKKMRLGDFEIDTIIGGGRQGAIVTIVDRKSMYLKLSVPCSKKSKIVANEIQRLLNPFKKKVHTITTDNGLEFAEHKAIAKTLECSYYFCDPYSSWQRGLNENINGLIRQYIPKGSSFENLTKKKIRQIENRLNYRPRKTLGWRTPYEVFHEKVDFKEAV